MTTKTPLQTLLDERASEFNRQFMLDDYGESTAVQGKVGAFLKESILQGVRLGLAMGRECVPETDHFAGAGDDGYYRGVIDCRGATLTALEAKEKELGV